MDERSETSSAERVLTSQYLAVLTRGGMGQNPCNLSLHFTDDSMNIYELFFSNGYPYDKVGAFLGKEWVVH